ncbi:MAG: ClpXP protease specificity-enhancing factor SspB [Pseudomonadota bacterium]
MAERIDYGHMMHRALRGLMSEVLGSVAEEGLPGEHHFFITFDTAHPGVDIPDNLKSANPEAMTIVLQHEFWDLNVIGDRFAVTLSFNDQPTTLVIPFDAIKTFVDPSVEFGLRFDGTDDEDGTPTGGPPSGDKAPEPAESGGADVVSLDRFRKT